MLLLSNRILTLCRSMFKHSRMAQSTSLQLDLLRPRTNTQALKFRKSAGSPHGQLTHHYHRPYHSLCPRLSLVLQLVHNSPIMEAVWAKCILQMFALTKSPSLPAKKYKGHAHQSQHVPMVIVLQFALIDALLRLRYNF